MPHHVPSNTATTVPQPEAPFDGLLGLRVVESGPDHVVTHLDIRPEFFQPYGITHGGLYCSMVESTASIGADSWVRARGGATVGVANHTNFLRSTSVGTLRAEAQPIQQGRTQQLWQVEIRDDRDRLIARGEVRFANLPADLPTT